MHNRRCSEAQPTDRQHPPQFFKAPHGARLWLFGLIISPLAGLCWVLSGLSVGCASLHLRLCTSHP
ncbi:MAG: hypothetical protein LBP87_07755 [Planctomycetaceae bacterium]|nr:hypothetical protein [Planctomycetaceae bacterium]